MNDDLKTISELDLIELDLSDLDDIDEFFFELDAGCGSLIACGHCGGC